MGSSPENHPDISIGNNVPFVFVDNQGAAWPGFGFILILGTFKSQQIGKKKVHDYLCIATWVPISLLQILKNVDTFIVLCSFWLLPLEE